MSRSREVVRKEGMGRGEKGETYEIGNMVAKFKEIGFTTTCLTGRSVLDIRRVGR